MGRSRSIAGAVSRRAILAGLAAMAFAGLEPARRAVGCGDGSVSRRTPGNRAYRTIPTGSGHFYCPEALAEAWALCPLSPTQDRG